MQELPRGVLLNNYKHTMYTIVSRVCPELDMMDILNGIEYSMNKKFINHDITIKNNYLKAQANTDFVTLSDKLLKQKAIMTTQGVLFKRHGTGPNPFYNFIQYLVDKRDYAKTMMKKYPKGSEEFNKWNLKQLNYKVSCNALYGCAGNWSSIFYNLYLCTAVTGQGRGCISASITMFESFLANNIKFGSLTEVLQFIDNIVRDQKNPKFRQFDDASVLDRNISIEEAFLKVMKSCGYNSWVPSDEARDAIWNTICNLDQRSLNVLYYKNNLYEFCSNTRVKNLILRILCKLEKPFLNPNDIPKECEYELVLFKDLLFEYVYYRHLYIDKIPRIYSIQRDVVLITDTDSCIVSLDQWYRFVLEMTKGVPMKIKYTKTEIDAAADKVIYEYQQTETEEEYDFYNEKLVEKKRLQYPMVIIEEDNLRYSIVDIMSYVVSQLILDYMVLFSENYNTYQDDRKCLLIMKNEFMFKSLLLTFGAKNYADLQLVQEGNIVPYEKQLDIKGLPITKVGMPKSTSESLTKILEFDILRKNHIDQADIIRKFATLEKQIIQSIKDKKKEFHKPARIKSLSYYDDPMKIQGIKASVAYNSIRNPDEEGINLDERNSILVIKTDINDKNVAVIRDTFPQHYVRIKELLKDKKYFKGKISSIAIPSDIEIPDWIVPFINYNEIIKDNLRNFPLEEIGISKMDGKKATHSNILTF